MEAFSVERKIKNTMDQDLGISKEIRTSNRHNLEQAFVDLGERTRKILDSASGNEPTNEVVSSPFDITTVNGKSEKFRLVLKPMNVHERNFSIDVRIIDSRYNIVAHRAVFADPSGSLNIDALKRKLDTRTVEYWSDIKVNFEDLKSVGIGSTLLDQSEKLVVSIWEKVGQRKNVDTLRIILRDRSTPKRWTSIQAEKSGYRADGKDNEDNPRFKKEISLSKRRSRLGGLLGRFSE